MKKKNVFGIICVLSVALVLPLFAAGQKEAGASNENAKVKLRLMSVSTDQNQTDILEKYIKKNLETTFPNFEIQYEPGGGGEDFGNKLKTYNASGDLPDVWYSATDTAVAIINAGNILDLTPYIKNDGFFEKYQVPEALIHTDGKIYAIGSGADTFFVPAIFYNKKIFADNGLTVPSNWTEFDALCKKLVSKKIVPISVMGKGGWAPRNFLMQTMIQMQDPQIMLDLLQNKTDFANPAIMKALDRIDYMADNKFFPAGVANLDYGPSLEMFTSGKTAMFGGFSWEVGNLKSNPDIGMFYWPTANTRYASQDVIQFWGSPLGGYAVNPDSKHVAEAVKFAEYCALMEAKFYAEQGAQLNLRTGIDIESDEPLVVRNNELYNNTTLKIPTLMLNAMDTKTAAEFSSYGVNFLTGDYSAEEFVEDFNSIWQQNTWFK